MKLLFTNRKECSAGTHIDKSQKDHAKWKRQDIKSCMILFIRNSRKGKTIVAYIVSERSVASKTWRW